MTYTSYFGKQNSTLGSVVLLVYVTLSNPDMEFPMMDQGIEEGMCNQVTQVARSTGKVSSGNQYRFRQIKT